MAKRIEFREFAPMERKEDPFAELLDENFPYPKDIKHVVILKTEEQEAAADEMSLRIVEWKEDEDENNRSAR